MNKPLPWNVKGVGFDAREAARIAAKRAGVPIGEWLNRVISTRAAELGVQVDDIEPDDRLEAIAARLSQDETSGTEAFKRPASETEDTGGAAAGADVLNIAPSLQQRRATAPARDEARSETSSPAMPHATPPLSHEEMVAAGQAIPTAQSLDRDIAARVSQTAQIEAADLDARLANILQKLDRSFAAAEARTVLNRAAGADLGRSAIAKSAAASEGNDAKPAANVETLVPPSTQTQAAADAEAPGSDFADLQAAFKELAHRLDGQAPLPEAAEARAAANDLAAEIAALARRVDELRGEPAPDRATRRSREVQALRREMEQLSGQLSQLSPQQSLRSLEAAVRELAGKTDLSRIEGVHASVLAPVERLSREMREAIRSVNAAPAVEALRRDMTALGNRIETLRPRESDPKTLEGLHGDVREMRGAIETLAERLGVAERLQTEVLALGQHVGALTERTSPTAIHDLAATMGDIRNLLRCFGDDGAFGALNQKIDTLAERMEAIASTYQPAAILDGLARQIDQAHEGLVARLSPVSATSELAALHEQIGALAGKIDGLGQTTHDVNALGALVGSLAERLDEVRNPHGNADALNALQAQIGQLVERLDRTSATDSTLQGLERLIGDLFLQIEQSRNAAIDAAENAARAAAQDTLRAAMDNPALNGAELTVQTGLDVDHVSQELAELRRVQETSDRRVNTTLTALNTTLERLVDRLVLDGDVRLGGAAEAAAKATPRRRGRVSPEPTVGDAEGGVGVPAFDPEQFLLEPGSVGAGDRAHGGADFGFPGAGSSRGSAAGLSTEVAPLIAAARRAAQAAQASALEASLKVDQPAENPAATPAGKTRSFFASKRRALLLGLASVVLLAGTLQIVRLSTIRDGGRSTAAAPEMDPPAEATAAAPAAKPAPEAVSPPSEAAPAKPPVAAPTPGASLPVAPPISDKSAGGFVPSPAAANQVAAAPLPAGLSPNLRDLASRGDAAAQYEVGARLSDGRGVARDPKQALTWFQRAAEQGFAPAQYRLGSVYEKGVGVTTDPTLAVAWYEKAAGQGNVRAMHNLAVMSAEGSTGKPDYGKAVTWFTKAASYGVRDSQFNLAVLFARGLGVPQSLDQSYAWFAVAAAQGDSDAVTKRDTVAGKLDAKALADAKATVASFHPLTPDAAANDVTPPSGGWDAAMPAKTTAGKTEAHVSSM